jgi:hypothetical protein
MAVRTLLWLRADGAASACRWGSGLDFSLSRLFAAAAQLAQLVARLEGVSSPIAAWAHDLAARRLPNASPAKLFIALDGSPARRHSA